MRGVALAVALLTLSDVSHASPSASGGAAPGAALDAVVRRGDWQRLDEARDAPPGWRGSRDRDTGVLASMWGKRVVVVGTSTTATLADSAARVFIAEHLAQLAPGTRIDDWTLVANQVAVDGKRTVAFAQRWHGLEVVGGQLQVVIARDAIFVALSQAQGHVAASLEIRAHELTRPPADFSRALAALRFRGSSAAAGANATRIVGPIARVVLPLEGRYELADRAVISDGRELWDVDVALDGDPLAMRRQARDATATLAFDVPQQHPGTMRRIEAARALQVTVDGVVATTRPDGTFDFLGAGVVQTSMTGAGVVVTTAQGPAATTQLTATDGGLVTWSAPTDVLIEAQLSAYAHVSIGKAAARVIVPGIETWLDEALHVTVNEPGGECNARSADDGLHFFAGSATCENTARIADVVYHELGHAVHARAVIAGAGSRANAALGEGLADYFATSVTGDSAIGRGFALDERPVREIDPVADERRAPDDLVPESHISGLIISGALWDLRKLLVAELGAPAASTRANRVYAGLLARAANIPGAYMAALVADDDDGDLANGTPNQCAIDRAFARHGLAPSTVEITTVGAPVVQGSTISIPVRIPPSACPQPQVTSVRLEVPADDLVVQLTRDVTGTLWGGTIPTGTEDVTRYRVYATFDDGQVVGLPDNRGDQYYTLQPTGTEEIWCERFDTDPLWSQAQSGSISTWQVGVSRGLAGDPTTAFTGANVLGIDLTEDGRYAAVGTTEITAPDVDVSGYENVHLQFRRWLTVEDGLYDRASIGVNARTIWTNTASEDGSIDHVDREWRFVDYMFPTSDTGPTMSVSWQLTSDASRQLGGWTLDDVCIVGEPVHQCPGGGDCEAQCDLDCGGCCAASDHPTSASLLGAAVLGLLRRRKRRSSSRT